MCDSRSGIEPGSSLQADPDLPDNSIDRDWPEGAAVAAQRLGASGEVDLARTCGISNALYKETGPRLRILDHHQDPSFRPLATVCPSLPDAVGPQRQGTPHVLLRVPERGGGVLC